VSHFIINHLPLEAQEMFQNILLAEYHGTFDKKETFYLSTFKMSLAEEEIASTNYVKL
jgi:hypothetical protein